MIFRIIRVCRIGVIGLFAIVLTYLAAALAGAVIPGRTAALMDQGDLVEIRLVAGPIHYDLLLPATPQTRQVFEFAMQGGVPTEQPGVEWIVVGWGARAFYTTIGTYADIDPAAIWRGIWGDGSVLRIDVAGALPPELRSERVRLSPARYQALLDFISKERVVAAGALDHPGFSQTDAYFPAVSRFNGLRTCNVWIAEALRAAGVAFGVWTPTPYSVRLSLWWHSV